MAKHLRRTLRGEEMWCQLFSEPGAGSDLAGLRTLAREEGHGWRVTGQKVWTTGAHVADFGLLLARTDPSLPKHAGITAFILDMKQPGVTVRPLRQITGHSEFNEVFIDDAFVSHDDVIGGVGRGWEAVRITLANERSNIGTSGTVRSPATSPDSLLRKAREPGANAPESLLEEIAGLYARQSAIELLGRLRKERSTDERGLASIGKLATARQTKESAQLALRMLGVHAVTWDRDEAGSDRWAYSLLTSPLSSIAGGTDDIQRNILGERVLGLPREPGVNSSTPFNEIQFGV
jgi:alkylation response protein AidB-like acyl-CoA dehydrogenase